MCCQGHQNSIREPNSEVDQSAMGLIGFRTSQKEVREVYHSVYLLNRLLGFPSCGEMRRRRAIQDILPSLEAQQQSWTCMTETQNLGTHGGEQESDMPHSYKAALWAAHQKALETAEALQSDLNRLNNECTEEGHGSTAGLEVNPGHGLEVDLGPILKVGPEIGQEPKVKVVTMLTPGMSVPTPQTTTRNSRIGE